MATTVDEGSLGAIGDEVACNGLVIAVGVLEDADSRETGPEEDVLGATNLSENLVVVALADALRWKLAVTFAITPANMLADEFVDRVTEPVANDRNVEFVDKVEETGEDGGSLAGRLSAFIISAAFGKVSASVLNLSGLTIWYLLCYSVDDCLQMSCWYDWKDARINYS